MNWKKYFFEFLSIFIAVISAFALNNWNENKNNSYSEEKILTEIRNGIHLDQQDFKVNMNGHQFSLKAIQVFRNSILGNTVSQDSIGIFYTLLLRDYKPIINISGYESLKASGLKTVRNDHLRFKIIELYDYYYEIIKILDSVPEMQSFQNYFALINSIIHTHLEFDDDGNVIKLNSLSSLSETKKKEILSYLWRLENNRNFKLKRYEATLLKMDRVLQLLLNELN